jgi:hypothetical protein
MKISEDRKDLFKAISLAQGEFTTVEKNAKNPHFNSKFAPLDSIIEMIRPILPKHGLSVMQLCDIPESGTGIIIETILTHETGQYISSRLFMPTMKNDPQGYGSSISYCRRYALGAALGIVSDEDVDGNQGDGDKGKGKQQQSAKGAAQGQQGGKAIEEPTKARTELLETLATLYNGNVEEMAGALRHYSSFQGKDKEGNPEEKFLTMANLEHPTANEKMHKWFGSALGKLRKDSAK